MATSRLTLSLFSGRGPVHRIHDLDAWDEYKTGFFLIEQIEKAFGQHGLFLWFESGSESSAYDGYDGVLPRSRNPKLPDFPFDLAEALRVFGLEHEALTGKFDGVDFIEVPRE